MTDKKVVPMITPVQLRKWTADVEGRIARLKAVLATEEYQAQAFTDSGRLDAVEPIKVNIVEIKRIINMNEELLKKIRADLKKAEEKDK